MTGGCVVHETTTALQTWLQFAARALQLLQEHYNLFFFFALRWTEFSCRKPSAWLLPTTGWWFKSEIGFSRRIRWKCAASLIWRTSPKMEALTLRLGTKVFFLKHALSKIFLHPHIRTAGRCGYTLRLEPEEEFKEMTAHKEVSAWLSSMELDVSDPKKLFNLIDGGLKRNLALNWREFAQTMHFWGVMLRVPTHLCQEVICIQNRPWQFRGDGTVSLEELVYGVGRLKGPARSQDVEPKQQKRTCHCTFCPGAVHVLVFFWFGVADKHDQSRPRHVSWKKSKTWKDCCCNKVHETKPCTLLHHEAKRPSKAVCV